MVFYLGIGMFLFWLSCFIGIVFVLVIYVIIGFSFDDMIFVVDFYIFFLWNIFGFFVVIIVVFIFVGFKCIFKKDFGDFGEVEEVFVFIRGGDCEINVLVVG